MTRPTRIVAKSPSSDWPGGYPLDRHCLDALRAADVLAPGTRYGDALARAFGIDVMALWTDIRIAAALHDIGKACASFQDAVLRGGRQAVRHEHLSFMYLLDPEMRAWLRSGTDDRIVLAAVLGHHLKAVDPSQATGTWTDNYRVGTSQTGGTDVYLDCAEVRVVLAAVGEILGRPAPVVPVPRWEPRGAGSAYWDAAHAAIDPLRREIRRAIRREPGFAARLAAVKIGVVVADSIASGVVQVGDLSDWIAERVALDSLSGDRIRAEVIAPRVAGIPAGSYPNEVQLAARSLPDRAALVASCGAGKTLAAWEWVATVAERRSIGSVLFLYPTKGTTVEGFSSYAAHAPDGSAACLFSSIRYAMIDMRDDPDTAGPHELADAESRLRALGYWGRRYVVATVDQVLSVMTGNRSAWCLAPVLADSAVVVDEVHATDPSVWACVEALLELDIPVLLMTATLDGTRRARLAARGVGVSTGATDADRAPRYRIVHSTDQADAIAAAMTSRGRVLVLCNTVGRAVETFVMVRAAVPDVPIRLYHGRYRTKDRPAVHRAAISALEGDGSVVVVCTQVAEMSFDIDADVLVTDNCSISALVQRMGRCRRRDGRDEIPGRGTVYIVPAPTSRRGPLVYTEDELATTDALVPDGWYSRDDLTAAVASISSGPSRTSVRLLTEGLFTTRGEFRVDDECTRTAVLESDLSDPEFIADLDARQPLDGWYVPALTSTTRERDPDDPVERRLPRWLGVCTAAYDPVLGVVR